MTVPLKDTSALAAKDFGGFAAPGKPTDASLYSSAPPASNRRRTRPFICRNAWLFGPQGRFWPPENREKNRITLTTGCFDVTLRTLAMHSAKEAHRDA